MSNTAPRAAKPKVLQGCCISPHQRASTCPHFSAALSDEASSPAALLLLPYRQRPPQRCDILTVTAPDAGPGVGSQGLELANQLEAGLILWRITARLTPSTMLTLTLQEEGEASSPDGQPQQGCQRRRVQRAVSMVAQEGQECLKG